VVPFYPQSAGGGTKTFGVLPDKRARLSRRRTTSDGYADFTEIPALKTRKGEVFDSWRVRERVREKCLRLQSNAKIGTQTSNKSKNQNLTCEQSTKQTKSEM